MDLFQKIVKWGMFTSAMSAENCTYFWNVLAYNGPIYHWRSAGWNNYVASVQKHIDENSGNIVIK